MIRAETLEAFALRQSFAVRASYDWPIEGPHWLDVRAACREYRLGRPIKATQKLCRAVENYYYCDSRSVQLARWLLTGLIDHEQGKPVKKKWVEAWPGVEAGVEVEE